MTFDACRHNTQSFIRVNNGISFMLLDPGPFPILLTQDALTFTRRFEPLCQAIDMESIFTSETFQRR